MATSEQFFSLVSTSKSSWVAVPVNREKLADISKHKVREVEPQSLSVGGSNGSSIFTQQTEEHAGFTERFPRLTIAMIAFVLFAVSVTAEVECLHQAGYYWR